MSQSDFNPDLQPPRLVPVPADSSSPARRWLPWALGSAVVLLVLCVGGVVVGARLFQGFQHETDSTLAVVDQFMRAGAHNDPASALVLFAQLARDQGVTQQSIATLFTTRRDTFDGYSAVQQTTFFIQSGTQGTTAALEGTVAYEGHPDRPFAATLRKADGQWKLVSIRFPEGIGP